MLRRWIVVGGVGTVLVATAAPAADKAGAVAKPDPATQQQSATKPVAHVVDNRSRCAADEVFCLIAGGGANPAVAHGPAVCVKRDNPTYGCGTCTIHDTSTMLDPHCLKGAVTFTKCMHGHVNADRKAFNGCEAIAPSNPPALASVVPVVAANPSSPPPQPVQAMPVAVPCTDGLFGKGCADPGSVCTILNPGAEGAAGQPFCYKDCEHLPTSSCATTLSGWIGQCVSIPAGSMNYHQGLAVCVSAVPPAVISPGCHADLDCSDGVFCNGREVCHPGAAGADRRGCLPAPNQHPCAADQRCDEARQLCAINCPDQDGDGHMSAQCGGDDCDDNDRTRFPGNMEVCDTNDHDEDCDPQTYGIRDQDGDGAYWRASAIANHGRYIGQGDDMACCNTNDFTRERHCGLDCDDTNITVSFLGSDISCNNVDENCDGIVDPCLPSYPTGSTPCAYSTPGYRLNDPYCVQKLSGH